MRRRPGPSRQRRQREARTQRSWRRFVRVQRVLARRWDIRHISLDGHERQPDGRVWAYSSGPFRGDCTIVVQPEGERWGVWRRFA